MFKLTMTTPFYRTTLIYDDFATLAEEWNLYGAAAQKLRQDGRIERTPKVILTLEEGR